jgi:hypothetical protein
VLFADDAKDHGGQASVAYRQGLRPLLSGLPVPEFESVTVLRTAHVSTGERSNYESDCQESKSHHEHPPRKRRFKRSEIGLGLQTKSSRFGTILALLIHAHFAPRVVLK